LNAEYFADVDGEDIEVVLLSVECEEKLAKEG
jgi:hypothetical protein